MKHKVILAFTGLPGSGKGTAAQYFVDTHHAKVVKFSTSLRDILDRLYLDQSRVNMLELSRVLRETFGEDLLSGVIARDAAKLDSDLLVIDGVRRIMDVKTLRQMRGFKLIAIDAPQKIRYERMVQRGENPDDKTKSWDQFQKDEEAEAEQHIPELLRVADVTVDNSGDIQALHGQLEKIYQSIKNESQG